MSENFREPQSANEAILQNILGAQNELREPQSVVEFYLQKILEQGSGTSVVANPTLEGTESALSGLEVDGTKYKVESGGGALYQHSIRFVRDYTGGNPYAVKFNIFSTTAQAMTASDVFSYLAQHAPNQASAITAVGWYKETVNDVLLRGNVYGIYGDSHSVLYFNEEKNVDTTFTINASNHKFYDNVIQIS